ncbi:MAG: bifunctional folylpolyglutamate synthase/dihydrofolate synthase [Anaerolineales bacterium]|nr:bifunctional folylpolyglutamate synthase/dihydrofolate synthase [Anaerolineales bacterium]
MEKFSYQQALDYLYSFIDYSLQRTYQYSAHTLDLGRMHAVLGHLGDPHKQYAVVHVAGTKGKGSVSAMVESALRAAGCRTGLFISPHLIDFCERIRMNGEPIAHGRLAELVGSMRTAVAKVPELTTFEITTAAAFLYFKEEKADVVIAEVGLGGRLDATNVVSPQVSVITSLSYDHTHLLGNTLAEITREKAGIIKPGIPVVSSPQEGEAMKVLLEISRERHAPLILVGRDWHFAPDAHTLEGQSFHLWPAADQERVNATLAQGGDLRQIAMRYEIPLLGYHQVINAATAVAVLRTLRARGMSVPEETIREGLRSVRWEGRFQLLNRAPWVVVDSAHNVDSARRLRIALDDYFPTRRVVLLFGASDDKDIAGMLDALLPRVSRLVATRSTHPRAATPEKIAALARERGCPAEVSGDPAPALAQALRLVGSGDVLLAAGSLFVAGAVLEEWPKIRDKFLSGKAAKSGTPEAD